MDIDDFAGKRPQLLPEEFLSGHLEGWGVLESVLGNLQNRYTIAAEGSYSQGLLTFTETWSFDDGRQDTLAWRIRKLPDRKYEGTETRIVGTAKGEQAGFAFHWEYTRDTPSGSGETRLNFNDWFYLIDERTCIVRGSAGRAGIPFATAHVTYRRID